MMTDGALEEDLGGRIAALVQNAYQKLGPACKPVVRSNGLKEWTVLAGTVAVSTDKASGKSQFRLISIGTGVKALPDVVLARSQGKMVHDCHAEILALRGLNTVILEHINYLKKNPLRSSDLIEKGSTGAYAFKNKWELALYISTLPCGDASMIALSKTAQAECDEYRRLSFQESDRIQWIDEKIRTIIRGRFNYGTIGVVRTKPGRYDSQITYSKSCSDKLCAIQVTSVLNSLTWELMEAPLFLKYLVIPKETHPQDLRRSFRDRLAPMSCRPLEFLTCTRSFCDGKSDSTDDPSSMACVKLFIDLPSVGNIEQAILNGVRNGFYTKDNKPLRTNCEPIVSRYAQWKLFTEIRPELSQSTYLAFKAGQDTRNKLICDVKRQLSPDGWIRTCKDDCQL
ncbi:hypothetical protein HG536_0D05960 [Torulaspora globosa]|uniref:A to I editase domain-containing protein n=1 Tax=Torulaspora globosa TaxID=48254 RepID=A0A7G3ZHT8_9SACH|nr:uncharacterized protein HG536_0D05960 [Torulaspora globosa]QLL33074.1 hypothetical protein HG536_0D05960 [Torulaspora globosa]